MLIRTTIVVLREPHGTFENSSVSAEHLGGPGHQGNALPGRDHLQRFNHFVQSDSTQMDVGPNHVGSNQVWWLRFGFQVNQYVFIKI